jgi:hypothetical protein
MDYIYLKYKDIYTIENTGVQNINYTINIVTCENTSVYKTGIIKPNEIYILPITNFDSEYLIVLTVGVETENITIKQYNNILISFIENVEKYVCNCGNCNDCRDCGDCQGLLNSLTIGYAYLHLNHTTYINQLNIISNFLKCNYSNEIICYIKNYCFKEIEDTKNLSLLNIGLLYLSFYLLDLLQAQDKEEANYIKDKYKSSKILKCLRKLGININNFTEETIGNMNVYFWQLDNTTDNITNVIPTVNVNFLQNISNQNINIFEQGYIVNYNNIGRICFAVSPSVLANFQLTDSLGNDITDEFDTHYFPSGQIKLFVSKIPYSYSNVFFKFKKITFSP